MTARTPLYYDGSGSLIELSSAEIVEYQRQAIKHILYENHKPSKSTINKQYHSSPLA